MSSPENSTVPNQPKPDKTPEMGGLPPLPPLPEQGSPQPAQHGTPFGTPAGQPASSSVSQPVGAPGQHAVMQPGPAPQPAVMQPGPAPQNQQFPPPTQYQPGAQVPMQPGAQPTQPMAYGSPVPGAPYGQAGAFVGPGPVPPQMPVQPRDPNGFGPTLGRAFKAIPESFLAVVKGRAGQAFKLTEGNKLYWAVIMLIGALGFAIMLPLAAARLSDMDANSFLLLLLTFGRTSSVMALFNPGAGTYVGLFVLGLIFWCAAFALMALAVFGTWRVSRGHGSYQSALNMVAVPFTPISAVMVLWGLASAIPATEFFNVIAFLALFGIFVFALGYLVLTYIGINQHERLGVSPFLPYVLLTVGADVIISLIYFLIVVIVL